jgi:ribosomal protein S18 acetylase RimI-like enzyme
MKFQIRPARMEDAAAIAHVQVESWRTTYPGIVPDAFLNALNKEERARSWQEQMPTENNFLFVAEDETGIFGFASGGEVRDRLEGYDAELYTLYLLQGRQKQGVGRALTLRLSFALQACGFKSMLVWVLEQNSSVEFYRRLGAVPLARKVINIGGADLQDLALGWPSLDRLIAGGDQG